MAFRLYFPIFFFFFYFERITLQNTYVNLFRCHRHIDSSRRKLKRLKMEKCSCSLGSTMQNVMYCRILNVKNCRFKLVQNISTTLDLQLQRNYKTINRDNATSRKVFQNFGKPIENHDYQISAITQKLQTYCNIAPVDNKSAARYIPRKCKLKENIQGGVPPPLWNFVSRTYGPRVQFPH